MAQSGCLGKRKKKGKKRDGFDGCDPGCDGCDLCLLNLMSLRILTGLALALLGVGRTVRTAHREPGAPSGFLARRLHTAVRYYQLRISPRYPARCRYTPTCSAYAVGALRRHGALRGGVLTVRRLASCRPGGGHGADPVPEATRRT